MGSMSLMDTQAWPVPTQAGPVPTQAGPVPTQTEPVLVEQVTARVHERLRGVSLQAIEGEVTGLFQRYADSKVRTFLPILVERDTIDHLRHHQTSIAT